ncbi:MAG: hypothetical protein IPH45_12155 [Bacteroidales bacterium]|nr:hypothetical protein [Bacteroidales bacterium]
MAAPIHRIRKQVWSVRTDKAEHAFNLRMQLRDEWESLLLPVFEKVFNEVAGGDEVIHISKLSLQIRDYPTADPEGEFQKTIYRQLMEQLKPIQGESRDFASKGKIVTRKEYNRDVFLHYLETGNLPWDVNHITSSEIKTEFQKVLEHERDAISSYIRSKKPGSDFLFRWLQILQDHPVVLAECLEKTFNVPPLSDFSTWILEFLKPAPDSSGLYDRIMKAAILLEDLIQTQPDLKSNKRKVPGSQPALISDHGEGNDLTETKDSFKKHKSTD